MTIKLPELNMFDRLLYSMGKKRGVILPAKTDKDYGQYAYAIGKKENFWKALLRPRGADIPEEMADLIEYHKRLKNI